jgi:hypothetical protein
MILNLETLLAKYDSFVSWWPFYAKNDIWWFCVLMPLEWEIWYMMALYPMTLDSEIWYIMILWLRYLWLGTLPTFNWEIWYGVYMTLNSIICKDNIVPCWPLNAKNDIWDFIILHSKSLIDGRKSGHIRCKIWWPRVWMTL